MCDLHVWVCIEHQHFVVIDTLLQCIRVFFYSCALIRKSSLALLLAFQHAYCKPSSHENMVNITTKDVRGSASEGFREGYWKSKRSRWYENIMCTFRFAKCIFGEQTAFVDLCKKVFYIWQVFRWVSLTIKIFSNIILYIALNTYLSLWNWADLNKMIVITVTCNWENIGKRMLYTENKFIAIKLSVCMKN